MQNNIIIAVRAYPVTIRDERSGEECADMIVLDKRQCQAAQLVGQGSDDVIYRLYNRRGYRVLAIGKPIKREISLDLGHLFSVTQ